jgi:hypothetical protein
MENHLGRIAHHLRAYVFEAELTKQEVIDEMTRRLIEFYRPFASTSSVRRRAAKLDLTATWISWWSCPTIRRTG